MSWAAVIIGGATLVGGAVASQGAKKASSAAAGASDAAISEQRRQFDTLLGLTAPQRAIGEQALNALGGVYGYKPSSQYYPQSPMTGATPYQASQIPDSGFFNTGAGAVLNPWTVTSKLGGLGKILDPAGGLLGNLFGGGHGDEKRNLKAFTSENQIYDLGNGMLALADGTTFPQSRLQDVAGAWYGATYAPDGNQAGWQQTYAGLVQKPSANVGQAGNGLTSEGVNQGFPGGSGGPVTVDQNGNIVQGSPNYENFFASPDYRFRLKEGMSAVENSAAARGGLYSGNALRGVTEYGQGLAAGEFGNWFNRQAALAGIGQTATSQAGQGAMATGANVGNLLVNQGNARASGIVDQTNALTGTLNQLAMLYGSGAFGGGGFKPNAMMTTGYGVPYGGRLA